MKKTINLLFALGLGICSVGCLYYCSGSGDNYSSENSSSPMNHNLFSRLSGEKFTITDPHNQGMPIVSYDLPQGWTGTSEVKWNMQNVNFPATVYARMESNDKQSAIEIFPSAGFFWLDNPQSLQYFHQGQSYNGQIMARVTPPADALIQYVVKPLRGRESQFRIVESRPLPNLAKEMKIDADASQLPGVMVTISYQGPRGPVKEEFYALYSHQPISTAIGVQHNWFLFSICSFKGAPDQLDKDRSTWKEMLANRTENPKWGQVYQQTMASLANQFNQQMDNGYASIRAAGQMSQQISANNDAMIRNMDQQRASSWSPTSGYSERAANNFDNYIKDEETYVDPYTGTSQQSSSYDYIWTDGYGNYRPSNEASYNPNIGSNQSWTLMKRKH